ncbi:alpha/beta fold hydrolase [Methyloceanibacter sp.]|uniref:thioesterase domain-containing protein n=1 Tax=Methyloceanibacter sp. TaxID=1965321 RepID=UPI003D6D4D6C
MGEQTQIAGRADRHADFVRAEETIRRADLGLAAAYVAPGNEVERKLSAIWQEAFGIDVVGVLDDFFELGGDSLTATTLAAEIEATFGRRFTPADLINLSTIAQQVELVADAKDAAPELPACLVLGRAGGPNSPVFMVHGGKGFAFFGPAFFDIVGEGRSIYLFQAPGLDGRTPLESFDDVVTLADFAGVYVEAMRKIQPAGPYHIVAMCSGCFIALEMCEQLEKTGEAVRRLILLDPTSVPPVMKPAAIPALKEKKQAKQSSKRKLSARIRDWLRRPDEAEEETEQPAHWAMPPKKTDDLRQRIQQRVEQMKDVPPEQRSYTEERMYKMSQQFRAALYTHVPRRYEGSAIMLVSAMRAKETLAKNAFWPNNLGSVQCEVLGSKHKDLFEDYLPETARFVSKALA